MIDFLKWLTTEEFYKYKDGTYFSPKRRKFYLRHCTTFYKLEELIELYDKENPSKN